MFRTLYSQPYIWILTGLLLFICKATAGSQSPEGLALMPGEGQTTTSIIEHLYYLEDKNGSLSPEMLCCEAVSEGFRKFDRSHIDFGFSTSQFWLNLPVINRSVQEGQWMLALNTRFMNGLSAYLVTAQEIQLLTEDSENRPFAQRQIPYRYITTQFSLKPGEQAEILISYWSRGTTVLPITIETETSFYKNWVSDSSQNAALYSAMLFMILFSLFQFVILRSTVQLGYASYVTAVLLYCLHMDGYSFQYLWPNWPQWNAAASLYLGLQLSIFAIAFARAFLNTRQTQPIIDRILLALMITTVVLMLLAALGNDYYIKKYSFGMTSFCTLICLLAGVVSYVRGQRSARFFIAGWLALLFCASYTTISHWWPNSLFIPLSFDITKVGILFDALMFALAMADQAQDVRQERDAANAREKALLENELEAQKNRLQLEQKYQEALSLAQSKSLQLASAGHDLRQPIVALRLAMQRVYDHQQTDLQTLSQFQQGFEYIEKMITQFLELPAQLEAVPQNSSSELHSAKESEQVLIEEFPVRLILDNVSQMFRSEAEQKGLDFRTVDCSLCVSANPVALMRIVSNFVENAVKYTEQGKILVGCRRRSDHIEIQVCDTGPGFPEEQREALFKALRRGPEHEAKQGLGLGLAIASEMACEQGVTLTLVSQPLRGSIISVAVPCQASVSRAANS